MTKSVVEVVTFKLAQNVSSDAFIESAKAVNQLLDNTEGFVRRLLELDTDPSTNRCLLARR